MDVVCITTENNGLCNVAHGFDDIVLDGKPTRPLTVIMTQLEAHWFWRTWTSFFRGHLEVPHGLKKKTGTEDYHEKMLRDT